MDRILVLFFKGSGNSREKACECVCDGGGRIEMVSEATKKGHTHLPPLYALETDL